MIAVLAGIVLSAFPGASLKAGGVPPMLLNPDTVVAEESRGLPDGIGGVLERVFSLPGATFGLGVVDLNTGERVARNATRRFVMDTPDIVAAAYSVSRHKSGEFRLDSLVGRDTQLWMFLRDGQQGSRERLVASVYHCGDFPPLQSWLRSEFPSTEFNGVEREWEGAPESLPNYTTVNDCLDFMEIVYDALDITAVRRMTVAPPLSGDLEMALGSGNTVYGWISDGGDTRCINLIVLKPDGAKYGVSVLAEDLCCTSKADLAFSIIWNALK